MLNNKKSWDGKTPNNLFNIKQPSAVNTPIAQHSCNTQNNKVNVSNSTITQSSDMSYLTHAVSELMSKKKDSAIYVGSDEPDSNRFDFWFDTVDTN